MKYTGFKNLNTIYRLLAALGVSISISLIVGLFADKVIFNRAQLQFDKDSKQIQLLINASLDRYKDLLNNLRSLIASSTNPLNQTQFEKYANSVDILSQYPALARIDFSQYVTYKNLDFFYRDLENEFQGLNYDSYDETLKRTILDNKQTLNLNKEDFYIVRYLYPLDNSYEYLGLDIASNDVSSRALKNASSSNEVTSSGRIFYNKRDRRYPFISLRRSVFKERGDKEDKGYLKANYLGSIGVSIKIDKSLFEGLNENVNYINFQIFSSVEDGKSLIYDSRFQRKNLDIPWPSELFNEKELLIKEYPIKIGYREFTLKTFSKVYPPNVANQSVVFLIIGVAFLISLIVWSYILVKKVDDNKKYKKVQLDNINLERRVITDELSGLFNRVAFFQHVNEKIEENPNVKLWVFFQDLDGFKRINDSLGHSVGDIVLKEYAHRLKELSSRFPNTAYRMGGDEFIILLEQDKMKSNFSSKELDAVIKSIQSVTDMPFYLKGEPYYLSQSIGVCQYKKGVTSEELFTNSDIAMYEAKKSGKNQYKYYTKEFAEQREKKNKILNVLLTAIEKNEFFMIYQPKMEKVGDKYYAKGVEALIRWNSDKLGEVYPSDFIPLAEESGYIIDIGNWLIRDIAKTASKWKKLGLNDIKISINISAKQLLNDNLAHYYAKVLEQYNVSPSSIIIEITESAVMIEPEKTKKILTDFRKYGFGVSIDDFGTGHSSLSYLRQFPVTELKIDKSFTDDVLVDEHDAIIVEGITSMVKKLKIDVVIEGVENIEQVNWIENNLGSNICVQGYYYSIPLKESEILDFIKKTNGENKNEE